MPDDYAHLLDELQAAGRLSPRWRDAFEAYPRHRFLPDRFWASRSDQYLVPVDRATDPAGWTAAGNSDAPVVTQMDDGTVKPGEPAGRQPTSSSSMPTIVAIMLDAVDLYPGLRVLEIGTGTGWTAALMSHVVGDSAVTTVEVDEAVAAVARENLVAAGLAPGTVCGDGTAGYPPAAPYDRVIATCSVGQVPYEWVRQARPGGIVLAPWSMPDAEHTGRLIRLEVADDGTASGNFLDWAGFMRLRGQRWSAAPDTPHAGPAERTATTLRPDLVFDGRDAMFAVALRVPGLRSERLRDAGGGTTIALDDPASGSWATVTVAPGVPGSYPVAQGGPRRLWDEARAAYAWWLAAHRPPHTRFGLTVTAEGQWTWLDGPDQPVLAA